MKKIIVSLAIFFSCFFFATGVSAHVVVKPNQAGVGSFQTFSVGVPTEKDNPTVSIKLIMPEGLKYVTPNVKPGWTITEKREHDTVTEIEWTGGNIPSGQRDDFVFSAQIPANESTLIWKAYQTYQNGETVSWDQKPASRGDDENVTPYSTTKVVNDIVAPSTLNAPSKLDNKAFIISLLALALSVASFVIVNRKK